MVVNIFEICKTVLHRLCKMDYEKKIGTSSEQLIFPTKRDKDLHRISEQELRQIFIEEFKLRYPDLFYSIETPTTARFSFGKCYEEIKVDEYGKSASHDMCIFERNNGHYIRKMNIEFKHRNSSIKNSGKDILKLMMEDQDGVFIHLLENTNDGTLKSIFFKLQKCFSDFHKHWDNEKKVIELVILSLEQEKLIYCCLHKVDLINLESIFRIETGSGNINNFRSASWNAHEHREVDL